MIAVTDADIALVLNQSHRVWLEWRSRNCAIQTRLQKSRNTAP